MRNQLIPIRERNGQKAVSARELYNYLEINSVFTTWCKRMFEYGFEQEQDFIPILEESTGGRPKQDYALTIDTAKEISMLQRSEKGKQARRYFIECEKIARSQVQPMTMNEIMLRSAQLAVDNERRLLEQEGRLKALEAKSACPVDFFSVKAYAALNRIPIPIKEAAAFGRRASSICKQRGITVEKMPDPRFGTVNVYPVEILEEVFPNNQKQLI